MEVPQIGDCVIVKRKNRDGSLEEHIVKVEAVSYRIQLDGFRTWEWISAYEVTSLNGQFIFDKL